ncbi:MAG TPA: LLM class flavin-dependent oxidoreductase [Actinomycetota bacterium]|nr:LLM class flavin-dependent oxidoreductase [Actinomycetota bacterium]
MSRVAAFVDAGRSLDEAVERVRLAESLGYDSAWVTHIATREPLQVLGHYAHSTSTIGLGTGVVPFALRHPALLGMEAATLDEVTGGRLRLGIGVSHQITIEGWYGLRLDDPVGRITEYTTILRSIFTNGGDHFEGKHYVSRFSLQRFSARADLPILWAAMGPKMIRAAAEHADGIVLWMCSPSHIRGSIRPALDAALAEFGRSRESFEVIAAVPTALTEDAEAARQAFRLQALPYLNLPFYRKEIAQAHPEALAAFDAKMNAGDIPGALAEVGPEFIDDFAGIGDAATVRAKLENYRSAGVTLPAVGVLPKRAEGEAEATLEAAAPST